MQYLVRPFEAWHLDALYPSGLAEGGVSIVPDEVAQSLESLNSWSLLTSDGDVLAAGGTIEQWPRRHVGWLYFTPDSGRHMLRLTRLVRTFMEPVRGRIEATVRADFEPGHRFLRLLGFDIENPPGVMRAYGPHGEDHVAYVRFQ